MQFLYFFITIITTACALECYVTDLKHLNNENLQQITQNCEENLKQFTELEGIKNYLYENVALNCFKIKASGGSKDVIVKGCVPKNGCGLMKKVIESSLETGLDISCWECSDDHCNGGSVHFGILGLVLMVLSFIL